MHTDLDRIGSFACSDPLLNQLHQQRGVGDARQLPDVPTDCPQRDERLGWTGDLAVFAPTAAFLGDVESFLRGLARRPRARAARHADGTVPVVVPNVMKYLDTASRSPAAAIWGDAAVWVPWALWSAYGNEQTLRDAYPLMTAHTCAASLECSPRRRCGTPGSSSATGSIRTRPPDDPAQAKADTGGRRDGVRLPHGRLTRRQRSCSARTRCRGVHARSEPDRCGVRASTTSRRPSPERQCRPRTRSPSSSNCSKPTIGDAAGDRLAELVRERGHRISTGLRRHAASSDDALTIDRAPRRRVRAAAPARSPSWLYAVTMGATTIWERWDSMLPDGSINPGGMTSFNHYAFGAVADWMHRTVGGPRAARARLSPDPRRAAARRRDDMGERLTRDALWPSRSLLAGR